MFGRKKGQDSTPSPRDVLVGAVHDIFDPKNKETLRREAERAGERLDAALKNDADMAPALAEHLISAIEASVRSEKRWGGLLGSTPTLDADNIKALTHHLFKPLGAANQKLLLSCIAQDKDLTERFVALADQHYIRQDVLTAFERVLNPPEGPVAAMADIREPTSNEKPGRKRKRKQKSRNRGKDKVLARPEPVTDIAEQPQCNEGAQALEPVETEAHIHEVRVHGDIVTNEEEDWQGHARTKPKTSRPRTPFGQVAAPSVPYDDYVVDALIESGITAEDITRYSPDNRDGYKLIVVEGYDGQIAVSSHAREPTFIIRQQENIAEGGESVDTSSLRDHPLVWRVDRRGEPEEWAQKVLEHFVTDVSALTPQNKRKVKWAEREQDLKTSFLETIRFEGHVSGRDGLIKHGPLSGEATWQAAYQHIRRSASGEDGPSSADLSPFERYAWKLVEEGDNLYCEVPCPDGSA